jgi:hypothetical protein
MLKLRDRTEPYSIHYGYWNGDAEVDTPAWLAVELLTKIEQLKTAGKKEWMLALAYARAIGRLEERLFLERRARECGNPGLQTSPVHS